MNKYLPPLEKISQQVIITGLTLVVVAFLLSKMPKIGALVQTYTNPNNTL